VTISAFTEAGCKNANNDPHANSRPSGFKDGLPNWCNTKKAAGFFFWFAFCFWAASLVLIIMEWRSGKSSRPKDPPFQRPNEDGEFDEEGGDEESTYEHVENRRSTYDAPFSDSNRYTDSNPPAIPPMSFNSSTPPPQPGGFTSPTNPRPSMDVYGAFSDPAPTGYAAGNSPQEQDARLSRTMQYADPYAAIRASIGPAAPSQPPSQIPPPPRYSFEGRY
jgi:hypothetical protein